MTKRKDVDNIWYRIWRTFQIIGPFIKHSMIPEYNQIMLYGHATWVQPHASLNNQVLNIIWYVNCSVYYRAIDVHSQKSSLP